MKSRLGRKRWFLHERANQPLAADQSELSFLQKQFLIIAYDHYGQDESDLPREARQHL